MKWNEMKWNEMKWNGSHRASNMHHCASIHTEQLSIKISSVVEENIDQIQFFRPDRLCQSGDSAFGVFTGHNCATLDEIFYDLKMPATNMRNVSVNMSFWRKRRRRSTKIFHKTYKRCPKKSSIKIGSTICNEKLCNFQMTTLRKFRN